MAFEDAYGFRGPALQFVYISPWEFCKLWEQQLLKTPAQYTRAKETPRTEWTEAGAKYFAAMLQDPHMPQAKPGVHYRVIESPTSAYRTFPDEPATSLVRHTYVLVRRSRPCVPEPSGTPPLKRFMSAEDKSRLLSVYLRPWVLHRRHATAHVPHVADLDIVVTHALQRHRRTFVNKTVTTSSISYPRSFADAWEDYRSQHVVS